MSPIVIFHITAGFVSLLAGAACFAFRKGGTPHRLSGRAFSVAMLAMSASSIYLALLKRDPDNVIVGGLTFYLVASGWMAIRGPRTRRWGDAFGLSGITVLVAIAVLFFVDAARSHDGLKDGIPASSLFFLAAIACAFLVSDSRRLFRAASSGHQRRTRHLWRMSFAMFIATLSFFYGQAQVLPDFMRTGHIHLVPVFLVAALSVYWLVRVGFLERPREAGGGERTTNKAINNAEVALDA